MPTFPTLDALTLTALFLVPGYIWSTVHAALVPRRAAEAHIRLIEYLALSCLNHACWFWLFGLLFGTGFAKTYPGWSGLFLIVPGIVSPVMLGLLSGKLYQTNWPRRVLRRYGLHAVHHIPTAWDFQFARERRYWVIVTLRDGSGVFGLFGYRSFAGDDPKERDIYLETVYTPRHDGEWLPEEGSGGILIKADQVAAIEFRELEEDSYGIE